MGERGVFKPCGLPSSAGSLTFYPDGCSARLPEFSFLSKNTSDPPTTLKTLRWPSQASWPSLPIAQSLPQHTLPSCLPCERKHWASGPTTIARGLTPEPTLALYLFFISGKLTLTFKTYLPITFSTESSSPLPEVPPPSEPLSAYSMGFAAISFISSSPPDQEPH